MALSDLGLEFIMNEQLIAMRGGSVNTNLITPVQTPRDLTSWTVAGNITKTTGRPDPFGGYTATLFTHADESNASVSTTLTGLTAATTYTFSFYALNGAGTGVPAADNPSLRVLNYAVYDASNAAYIVEPVAYTDSVNTNNFRRVSVTFTTPSGCTSVTLYPDVNPGFSGGLVLFGAQLEQSSYPTVFTDGSTLAAGGGGGGSTSGTIGGPVPTAGTLVAGSDGSVLQPLPVSTEMPSDGSLAVPVRIAPEKKFRTTFARTIANGVDPLYWDLLATGAGQTVNQANGNLVITAGTTTNSETIIRSITSFTDSYLLQYSVIFSQRNANNNLFVEMVDVIGDGLAVTAGTNTATVTIPGNTLTTDNIGQSVFIGNLGGLAGAIPGRFAIASVSGNTVVFTATGWTGTASGTCSLFGMNYHQVLYTGTTATNVNYDAQRGGWNTGYSVATINTTASPGHLGILSCSDGRLGYFDQLRASQTGLQAIQRGSRVENVPSHTTPLFIQIRCVNGTSAPTATTITLGSVSLEDYNLQPVVLSDIKPFASDYTLPVSLTGPTGVAAIKASIALTTDLALVVRPLTMTDGTNTMPTLDSASRRGYFQITDGTNSASILATILALKTDLSSIAGTVVNNNTANGSTNRSQTVLVAGVTNNTDYSAQAWAAASGNGATIAPADGTGGAVSIAMNLTSWTAGASTGLYAYLQESPDNGTTWHDIWGFEGMTATGFTRCPAIPVGGRRRMRWVNRAGAATTATVTATAMASSVGNFPVQRQFYDWGTTGTAANSVIITNGAQTTSTSTITSALNTINQTTATYPMDGCRAITMFLVTAGGSGLTTAAVVTLQVSLDGTNWATTTTTCTTGTTTPAGTYVGVYNGPAKFVRGILTTAQAGGTATALSYIGFQGVN